MYGSNHIEICVNILQKSLKPVCLSRSVISEYCTWFMVTCNAVVTIALEELVSSPPTQKILAAYFTKTMLVNQIKWYHILLGEDGLT